MVLKLSNNDPRVSTNLTDYNNNNKYIICDVATSKWGSMSPSNLVRHIGWSQDSTYITLEFGHQIDTDKIPVESQRVYIIGPYTDNEKRQTTFELVHNLQGPSETVLTIPILSMEDSPDNILGVVDILVSDDKSKVSFRSSSLDNGKTDNISTQFAIGTTFTIPSPLIPEGKYSYIHPLSLASIAVRKLMTAEIDPKVSIVDIEESNNVSSIDILTNSVLYDKIKSDMDNMTVVLSKMNTFINDISTKINLIELYVEKVETETEAHGRYETLLVMSRQLNDDLAALKERKIDVTGLDEIQTLSTASKKLLQETNLICKATQQSIDKLSVANGENNGSLTKEDVNGKRNYLSYILLVITSLQLVLGITKNKKGR